MAPMAVKPGSSFGQHAALILLLLTFRLSQMTSDADQQFFWNTGPPDLDWLTAPKDKDVAAPILVSLNASVEFISAEESIDMWVANFQCTFQSSTPPLLSWHYMGRRIDWRSNEAGEQVWEEPGDDNLTTAFLSVANFSQTAGQDKYTCLAVNTFGFRSGNLWPPAIPLLRTTDSTERIPGTDLNLTCEGYPGAQLFWQLPGSAERYADASFRFFDNTNSDAASILTIIVDEQDNGAPYRCCIASEDPRSNRIPYCSTVEFTVTSDPRVSSYEGCSAGGDMCNLSCAFTGSPLPDLIAWQYCSQLDVGQCSDVDGHSETVLGYSVLSELVLQPDAEEGIYVCSARNSAAGNDVQANHTFNITGTQVVPRLLEWYFDVEDWQTNPTIAGSATYTCVFDAASEGVTITWFKEGLQVSNGSEVIQSDGDRYHIDIRISDSDTLMSDLLIQPYGSDDYASSYTCAAVDQNGMAVSPPMVAHVWEDWVLVEANDNTVEVGRVAEIKCTSSAFPPPRLQWTVVAEFDLNYHIRGEQTENGTSATIVGFLANWLSDYVTVRCDSVNYMVPFGENVSNSTSILTAHDAGVVSNSRCDLNELNETGSCFLTSTIQHDPTAREKNYRWAYTAENSFSNQSLIFLIPFGYWEEAITPFRKNYTLQLFNYSAGFYHCVVEFYDPLYVDLDDIVVSDFKIESIFLPGSALGEFCVVSSDCLAYNSLCEDGECQCIYPNNIPLANDNMTSACLAGVAPGDLCYVGRQCSAVTKNYNCSAGARCRCDGALIQEEPDNQTLCLVAVPVGQNCTYQDECQLNDLNSECVNNRCHCFPNATYQQFDKSCDINSTGLSGGAIVGIVLACLAIASIVAYSVMRWRSNSKKKPVVYRRATTDQNVSIMWDTDSVSARTSSKSSVEVAPPAKPPSYSGGADGASVEVAPPEKPSIFSGGAEGSSADLIDIPVFLEDTWM